jgi:hypothetical protein
VSQKVAFNRTGSASTGVRFVPKPKERPIQPKLGLLTVTPDEPKGSVSTIMVEVGEVDPVTICDEGVVCKLALAVCVDGRWDVPIDRN